MCATAPRILANVPPCLVLDVDDLFDAVLGDRVEASDTVVEVS